MPVFPISLLLAIVREEFGSRSHTTGMLVMRASIAFIRSLIFITK
jgi:hypothetical protein